ncbi:MAG: SLC13 family permease [Salinarimonas sp.]|nr:SLC13 family permease [Salinarimonas sp.]
MTAQQWLILTVIGVTMAVFIWGRWRHDLVALAALIACVLLGLVPGDGAFAGFGHPAVITVACVLILSRGLSTSGAVDWIARKAMPVDSGPGTVMVGLCVMAGFFSAFMNNIGALALLMPIALDAARRLDIAPGQMLMPLSFASILGGMTTLIGTPPNLIVASFRADETRPAFGMFDFAPVGLAVAAAGIAFIVIAARFLVPQRNRASAPDFNIGAYLTEARVTDTASAVGMSLREVEVQLEKVDAQVVGLVRDETRIPAPHPEHIVQAGDILVIEADSKALGGALTNLGLKLEEDRSDEMPKVVTAGRTVLLEVAVRPGSPLAGRTAQHLRLRRRLGINLLAISRQGRRSLTRLRSTRLSPGDVLLLQGASETLSEFVVQYECVPLAERALHFPRKREAFLAGGLMLAAIAATASGLLRVEVAFAMAALAYVALDIVPVRRVYEAIDWSVIVLLGALIPVAGAVQMTGAAGAVAGLLFEDLGGGNAFFAVVVMLILTMWLTDFMNNAATAAVMAPVALGAAETLAVSPDPLLMAVAVGASCAFLTPIGHQNNTLILGPGGFRFGDYWRLGMPLQIIIIIVAVPMILWVWPL